MRQLDEGPSYAPLCQPGSAVRDKEARRLGIVAPSIPSRGVALQCTLCGGVQRHVARLAELRVANRQHSVDEIDVIAVEPQWLIGPQAGDHVQAEERGECVRPQTGGRR